MPAPTRSRGVTPQKLTVDFTGVEVRAQSFHFPEGDYLMSVKDAKVMPTKNDDTKKQIVWTLVCVQPAQYAGKAVLHRNTLTKESMWALRSFMVALYGSEEKVPQKQLDIPLASIVAKHLQLGVTLSDDEYNNKIVSKVTASFPKGEYQELQKNLEPEEEATEEETEEASEEEDSDEIDLDDL